MSQPEAQEDSVAAMHEPTQLDKLEYTVRRLQERIGILEQDYARADARLAAAEAHNALTIEELQSEIVARYKTHTRHISHGDIHVV